MLEGDVLTLDAPDDYEGLPQKTLATVKWVHGQTRFSHLYKVDDDCFVNAEAFFHVAVSLHQGITRSRLYGIENDFPR